MKRVTLIALAFACVILLIGTPAYAQKGGKNGTTLAAYKTIDICDLGNGNWRYYGLITAWNEGAIATQGLAIRDCIQFKLFEDPGPPQDRYCTQLSIYAEIPPGTTQETASQFPYRIEAAALLGGYIRNSAQLTILNHSGSLGTPKGPNPKATYEGQIPPPLCADGDEDLGCTYTQGYWGSKPGVVWPAPYSRTDMFFLSGQTWQQVMDTPVNVSQGYYQLAHQYIAAVLNAANGAAVPTGVQETLDLALGWLTVNVPSACTGPGSCGDQRNWAKVLDNYNNGVYPGGPPHCGN